MINILKSKVVTKTKIYNGNKYIAYYTKKKGKKKYKVYSKGIVKEFDSFLGKVDTEELAIKLIKIKHGLIKVGD
ncbi:hypothetical protein [Clostridium sp.]|uniref:hypothetical protein n=1 Tax=Clostridium sp. TaxID=1506 RepID=UPI0026371CCD|nr:hypothetical protein [Clostridium sp.]